MIFTIHVYFDYITDAVERSIETSRPVDVDLLRALLPEINKATTHLTTLENDGKVFTVEVSMNEHGFEVTVDELH